MGGGALKRGALIAAGSVSLALGVIGIVLPLLPTTPFVLLAASCYLRSSERLARWLLEHPRLGPPILAYRAGRGISRRAKVIAMVTLWGSITLSALYLRRLWLALLLGVIASAVSYHLLRQKTLPPGALEVSKRGCHR